MDGSKPRIWYQYSGYTALYLYKLGGVRNAILLAYFGYKLELWRSKQNYTMLPIIIKLFYL